MRVAQFDLDGQHALLKEQFDDAWHRVLASGRFVLGEELRAFEMELARYLGGGHVVGVKSGSDALYLALRAIKVAAGDEVVLPAYTFSATLEAVLRVGAVPKFVDSQARSFNSSPQQIIDALTARTRAVIVVHLFGQPVDLSELAPLCRERGIALIEDAAQALGAHCKETKIGTLGDIGCFSFYPSKNLGALGDGGAMWVQDARLADRLRALRNHGQGPHGELVDWGINSRLDELQAAMLRVKLPWLDRWSAARKSIAQHYEHALVASGLLADGNADEGHGHNQFSILHPQRDDLKSWLQIHGIETRIYYRRPLHLHAALGSHPALAFAESHARHALALPMYPELGRDAVARICDLVLQFSAARLDARCDQFQPSVDASTHCGRSDV